MVKDLLNVKIVEEVKFVNMGKFRNSVENVVGKCIILFKYFLNFFFNIILEFVKMGNFRITVKHVVGKGII